MTVSSIYRNVQSSVLSALSIVLLLPSVPVMAFEESVPIENETIQVQTAIPLVDQLESEPKLAKESLGESSVSSIATPQESADIASRAAMKPELVAEASVNVNLPALPSAATHTEPSALQPKDPVVISAIQISGGMVDFVQLKNIDDTIVSALDLSLVLTYHPRLAQDSPVQCEVAITGYILPNRHLVVASNKVSGENVYTLGVCGEVSSEAITVELRRKNQQHPTVNPDGTIEHIHFDDVGTGQPRQWTRRGFTNSRLTGVLETDFLAGPPSAILAADALYAPPASPDLSVTEILARPNNCSLDDSRLTCNSYIKVVNESDSAVNLALYRLRSGSPGETASKYNMSELSGLVEPHSYAILYRDKQSNPLAIDKNAGTVWFEDAYGVVAYENSIMPYEKADTIANRGRVWAYDIPSAAWKWGNPSPDSRETNFTSEDATGGLGSIGDSAFVACRADQYRNPATNRCNAIEPASTALLSCAAGQYRNPQTNRCNSVASSVSTLKPCSSDEFRNPTTNRCNKISSTTSSLQACAKGYERNAETNRCRKVTVAGASSAAADFPVQPIKDGTKAFVGWWALGGLLILGAGYASWEWRHEIANALKSVGAKISSSKGK